MTGEGTVQGLFYDLVFVGRMRGDMGGAATVSGAMSAIAQLGPPLNVVTLIPLTENMPGGRATRPGDVVTAMNGKTIQVDNTDAEGRLILADALCYADTVRPAGHRNYTHSGRRWLKIHSFLCF